VLEVVPTIHAGVDVHRPQVRAALQHIQDMATIRRRRIASPTVAGQARKRAGVEDVVQPIGECHIDIIMYGEVSQRNGAQARRPWIICPRLPYRVVALPRLMDVEGLEFGQVIYQPLDYRVLRFQNHVARECVHLSEMGCDIRHLRLITNARGNSKLSNKRAQCWLAIEDIE
jgi:hypothetical protein